MMFGEDCWLL